MDFGVPRKNLITPCLFPPFASIPCDGTQMADEVDALSRKVDQRCLHDVEVDSLWQAVEATRLLKVGVFSGALFLREICFCKFLNIYFICKI